MTQNKFPLTDIKEWTNRFIQALDTTFGDRVCFVGLQGSYGRGEATEASDIDMVVILDELVPCDVEAYNTMLDGMPRRELICGFLSGKNEIKNWEPSDLFQFYHDTTPIKGSLDDLFSCPDHTAIKRSIKIGACNIYHGCVHNMLYEKSDEILKGLYKSATFVLQALYFERTGKYISRQKDLLLVASDNDKQIINTFLQMKNGVKPDFKENSEALFLWSKALIGN